MDSNDGADSDAAILGQIRELAAGISDERSRAVLRSVSGALELNPQPIPPGILRIVLEAIALNPQPLPPVEDGASRSLGPEEVTHDPRPIPPGVLRTVLEAIALNPQPLPPAAADTSGSVAREEVALNPQPLPPEQGASGAVRSDRTLGASGRRATRNPGRGPPRMLNEAQTAQNATRRFGHGATPAHRRTNQQRVNDERCDSDVSRRGVPERG